MLDDMKNVSETSILAFCMDGIPKNAQDRIYEARFEEMKICGDILSDFLLDVSINDEGVTKEFRELQVSDSDLGFRVGRIFNNGRTVRIYTFGLVEASKASALQILGIALTFFMAPLTPAIGVQTLAVMKTLWDKLIVLERPQNADAIDALESIAKLRAIHLAEGDESMPSTTEIVDDLEMESDAVTVALKWLESKKIIEASNWGDQEGNVAHPETRWQICL